MLSRILVDDPKRRQLEQAFRSTDIIYHEPVKLKGGTSSDYYVDIKKGYGNPNILYTLSELIFRIIEPATNCIACSGYGGTPVGSTVSSMSESIKLVLVRENQKQHGKGGFIDGYVPGKGDSVAIFDDVLTTGDSIIHIKKIVEETGASVSGIYVAVNRGSPELPFKVEYLFDANDLLRR